MDAWTIAAKDLRLQTRDRRAFFVLLVLPLVFITVIGMSTRRLADVGPADVAPSGAGTAPDSPSGTTAAAASDDEQRRAVYRTIVPSFTVLFAFFLINIMARSFIAEREIGTLRRLRMAPVTTTSLLVGKTLPFFILSVCQCLTLLILGHVVYGMPIGNAPWLLLPVTICTSLAATSLGLLVATTVRTDSQVSAYANLIVIGLAGISGCFLPRSWLPNMAQTVSLATPHAWCLIGYDEVLRAVQPQPAKVGGCCAVLMLFTLVFFATGCRRFRRLG